MSPAPRRLRGFFAGAVARPVALAMLFTTLVVLGLIAFQRIPLQLLPSGFSEPSLWVWVPNPGASAQENEEQVARVIEEELRTLTGISQLESWSRENLVEIGVDFDGATDMDLAKAEVRDRIERARPRLPGTIEEIGMWSESADQLPLTFYGIRLRGDPDRRDHLMEKVVVPRLEAVNGIGRVEVWGVLQDSVRILLDEDEVAAARLDLGQLIGRLASDNFALPMGEVDDGGREILLRSDMRFKSVEEIADFPIGNGLRLRDVGRVAKVKSVSNSLSRIDGAYAYYGMASKDSQSNVVETSRRFQEAIDELRDDPALKGDIDFLVFFLQGDIIEDALSQLGETAMWGGLLAVVVLFVFLRRVRLTLCVAAAIPVSALMAVVWEYFTGGSFNLLTMTGITLGIGMLVDNAVVVVENIARVHEEGESAHRAAVIGGREIALAITLATLTTVVVFLPLIFMTDDAVIRTMFGGIGIPLSVSLLGSLLLAVVFLPVIAARILGKRRGARRLARLEPLAALPARAVAHVVGLLRMVWYGCLRLLFAAERVALRVLHPLRWPLALALVAWAAWRWRALAGASEGLAALEPFGLAAAPASLRTSLAIGLGVPALAAALLVVVGVPRWRRRPARPPARPASFVPGGRSLIDMVVALNQSLVRWTLDHRLAAAGVAMLAFLSILVPATLLDVTPFGQDSSAERVAFRVEFETPFTLAEAAEEAAVYEEFLESKRDEYGYQHWSDRFDERTARLSLHFEERIPLEESKALERRLREELPRVPGHRLVFYEENESQQASQKVVAFVLRGPDSKELERLGEQARRLLESVPGLSQVSTPLESARDQVRVTIDRDLAQSHGVTSEAIQNTIAYTLRGWPLPRYQEEGRDVPFLIEYDEERIAGLATLRDLAVFGGQGMVPLSSFASLDFDKGTRSIYRKNGQTSFTLEAEVSDPLQVIPVTEAGYRTLAQLDLPRGYSVGRDDSALERQQQEFDELGRAFVLSVVLVFLLMGILFESVLLPFSVLFTIPFAILGSMWTVFLTGRPMDSMGWIGLIILAGVVVNNGIVLIDRIHSLRGQHVDRHDAVLLGCSQRVRPILMTALTTVCGLFPMMVVQPPSDGIDYRALATIVAGGLGASTFFTLWVVPLAYTVIDDLAAVLVARSRWWLRRPARTEAAG